MLKELENMSSGELFQVAKKLEAENQQLQYKVNNLQSNVDHLQSNVYHLQFRIDQLNRLLFGAKRERFISNQDENQMTLPFEVPELESEPVKTE